jgi:hypothetical protein
MFIFNTRYNYLPLNNRLHSYLQDVDPACTYYTLTKNFPAPKDSMAHCFFYCRTAETFLRDILTLINYTDNIYAHDFQMLFWYGFNGDISSLSQVTNLLFFDVFRFILFKNRQRHYLPTSLEFKIEFVSLFKWICKFNRDIKAGIKLRFNNTIFLQALG